MNYASGHIFDRCNLNGTCPKVIEHFGGAEVFALKMTTEWVGHIGQRRYSAHAQRPQVLRPQHNARWRRRLQPEYLCHAGQLPG
jgi:hypothetical protein